MQLSHCYYYLQSNTLTEFNIFCVFDLAIPYYKWCFVVRFMKWHAPLSGNQACCAVHSMTHHFAATIYVVRFVKRYTPVWRTVLSVSLSDTLSSSQSCSPVHSMTHYYAATVLLSGSFRHTALSGTLPCCSVHSPVKRQIKSYVPFTGIIRSWPYFPR